MVIILVAIDIGIANGQHASVPPLDVSQLAEDLVGTPDDDETFESSYEGLLQTISRPLNLNQASAEMLLSLGILSNDQATSIEAYRLKNGNFISVYELQAVPELPLDVIQRLRPFVTVFDQEAAIDRTLLRRIVHDGDSYLLARMSRAWSDPSAEHHSYTGSPEHLLMRFRTQRPGDFSFGFNTEKDAGESIKWDSGHRYYGFDHWSYHVQLQNKGIFRNVILGDYQAQFGQGLMFGGAFGPGKGAETITTMRRANVGIVPYTSAFESGHMRGAAWSLALPGKLELTVLFSHARRDAAVELVNNTPTAVAMQRSGLHRTNAELNGKQQIADTQRGCVLQRRQGPLELGLTFMHSSFSLPIEPKITPYNQFAFRGSRLSQAGMFFNYNAGRLTAFGEFVTEFGHGSGMVGGVLVSITRKLDAALLLRRYDPDFHPRFSNAISENSTAVNERGAYMGWRYHVNKKIVLSAYLDLFSFPWLRYRAYAPSFGYEWLWRFSYQPTRAILLYIQGRKESKARNAPLDRTTFSQAMYIKDNYWVHAEVGLRDHVRLRTKLQISRFAEGELVTRGIALSQDLRIGWNRWEIVARYALFDTDNFDNRLYSYENDVLFAYSMPAYNGTGIRKILMTSIDITRHLTIWARYAETVTTNLEARSPNAAGRYSIDREVRFQLRIQF